MQGKLGLIYRFWRRSFGHLAPGLAGQVKTPLFFQSTNQTDIKVHRNFGGGARTLWKRAHHLHWPIRTLAPLMLKLYKQRVYDSDQIDASASQLYVNQKRGRNLVQRWWKGDERESDHNLSAR
ncbi:hypothetical protein [Pseudomonas sp. P5_A2_2]